MLDVGHSHMPSARVTTTTDEPLKVVIAMPTIMEPPVSEMALGVGLE